jgi:hypothetical protein
MDQQTFADNGAAARRLTGRILVVVIFGLAIWNLIVSLMSNVVVPWLGALAGPNAGLPASFTRNYDYADLFVAVLEFCVAGIAAVSINWFFQRPRTQRQPAPAAFVPQATSAAPPFTPRPQNVPLAQAMVTAPAQPSAPPPKPPATPVAPPVVASVPNAFATTGSAASKPAAAPLSATLPTPAVPPPVKVSTPPPAPPPKPEPAKPKKEKPVYYNIVGEPVSDDED